jgi:polyisoprenoid-binding protein YceI
VESDVVAEVSMRKRTILALLAATLIPTVQALAQPVAWDFDTAHSSVGFSVRHMMISNVRGSFNSFKGSLSVTGDDPTTARIEVDVDMASVDTREPKRDEHLKSPDFFDAAKFPAMTFVSKKVAKVGDGKYKVTGDLTMHGVTREVVLDVEGLNPPIKDPWGMTRTAAHATTTLNRKDFGLTWNKALETGGVLVGEEVAITIDVEIVKRPPAAK